MIRAPGRPHRPGTGGHIVGLWFSRGECRRPRAGKCASRASFARFEGASRHVASLLRQQCDDGKYHTFSGQVPGALDVFDSERVQFAFFLACDVGGSK